MPFLSRPFTEEAVEAAAEASFLCMMPHTGAPHQPALTKVNRLQFPASENARLVLAGLRGLHWAEEQKLLFQSENLFLPSNTNIPEFNRVTDRHRRDEQKKAAP